MNTTIRKGTLFFYGDRTFARGFSRSGYFNKRESLELEEYGHTLQGLANGLLQPENEEEAQFVRDLESVHASSLYPVALWKKYLAAVEKSKVHHGFAKSSPRNNENFSMSA
ncbi:DUF413 domain-containing protein [Pseudocolwellia agarivorans]|uniref:DUF413 domain-containing protein n=1 Tax=Pseudocolwellia agarivorans TaxID=1911682 RepID=UPI000987549A|nr:DUF413 domain-containing protein [Pseudocolwellia agarivorans]